MTNVARLMGIGGVLAALAVDSTLGGCLDDSVNCTSELAQVAFSAQAGAVQPDGSVTVYGAIQFGDAEAGAELTVRDVLVGNQTVTPGPNGFNFRTWSISLPKDVLAALAAGTGQAKIPVV